jgi:hypothetical protein
MFYRNKRTETEDKYTSVSIRSSKSDKEGKSMVLTSSKSRNLIKAFSYGLLPLNTIPISIGECLFRFFFALATVDLVDFSAAVLAAAATSQAFLEALSSASRDDMRALAADKASVAQQGERKLDNKP